MFAEEHEDKEKKKRGKGKLFALILGAVGAAGFFLKKKREKELDEALWEEPRSL
jgi:hypothetical protein